MMGRRSGDQASLFYEFRLDDRIPKNHLLRRIDVFVTAALADVHEQLDPYYSEIGRPSVDPELMIRMLIVGYCYGLRSERKLTQEVELHLAYRWFCRLDLDDKVPHHSTFSENRLHRFRESDVFRHIFERVVVACMAAGLVKGEGFAVDASVMEANASRYRGKAPEELDWTEKQRQKRAVAEYLAALEAEAAVDVEAPDDGDGGGSESKWPRRYERQAPKVISPSDPQSAWTAKANKRVQFGYGLNYLIDIENAVSNAGALRSEAKAACRRHGLWDGQVPRLAGEGEENHSTHSGLGEKRSARRHLLTLGLPLGQEARGLHLSQRQTAPDQRHRARRTHAALPRFEARLRCMPDQSEVLHHGRRAQDPARPPRGRPRCRTAEDEDKGVRQIAR
jgi:transposase